MQTETKKLTPCPEPEDIAAYLRDELPENERSQTRMHLNNCAACSSLYEELQSTINLLTADEHIENTRDLSQDILAQIPEDAWQKDTNLRLPKSVFFSPILLRAAAALLLAVGLAYLMNYAYQDRKSVDDITPSASLNKHQQSQKEGDLWLVNAQDESGKWDPQKWGGSRQYTIGLTGLALLSLTKNENTAGEKSITKATDYLLSQQKEDGRFGDDFEGAMYNHGIATVSLLELYKKHQNQNLIAPIQKALTFIADQQLDCGGWGYTRNPKANANTAMSTWPLQALLLSPHIGWQDKTHSLQYSLSWLVSVVDSVGQFGYQQPKEFPNGPDALTAMGAYCVLRASNEGMQIDKQTIYRIKNALISQPDESGNKTDFYRTYFRICALNEDDAAKWSASLDNLQHELISQREIDGPHKGSWTPKDQWGTVGGRIYSTALASLSLEKAICDNL